MKLQRENKFKKMILSNFSKLAIIGGIGILGFGFFPSALKLIDLKVTSDYQNEIVAAAVNQDYVENESDVYEDDGDVFEESVSKYDFDKLKETNENIVGVIEGSCFEGGYYPIVSTSTSDEMNYYLKHSVDNQSSSLGTLFVDCNNEENDQVIRIWGHNFNNSGSQMFTGLANVCQDQETYDATLAVDNTLKLYLEDGTYELEVFACVVDDPREQSLGTYSDQSQFLSDMESIIESSVIETDTEVNEGDKVIILTTCTDLGSANDPYNRISVYCKASLQKTKDYDQEKTL